MNGTVVRSGFVPRVQANRTGQPYMPNQMGGPAGGAGQPIIDVAHYTW